MFDVVDMIKNLAGATEAVSKEVTQHEALKNSPELQRALVYQRLQDELDRHRAEISEEHLDVVRQLVAATDAAPASPS